MPRNAASSSVPPKDAARLRLSGDIQKRRLAETGAMRIPSTAPSALHKLAKATKQLGRASNSGDQVAICFAMEELNLAARSAAKAGSAAHPLVQEWMAARRALANRASLRALKNAIRGATEGISPQLALKDIWLRLVVPEIMAQTKPRPTIAEVQERARERLRSEGWLPDLMKRGFVHEDPRRIQDGRKLDKAARNALIEGAKNDRRRLRDAIEKQLAVTPRAFANLLIGLGLHEPRTRRR